MKLSKLFLALLATTVVLSACRKDLSSEGGELPGEVENSWEFNAEGTLNSGPMDSGYVQSVGSVSTLSMVGSTSDDKQGEIFLQIVGESISTGSYTNPLVFFQYSENGNVVYQSSPVQTGAFSINITEIDSTFAAGTFSGTVIDEQGNEHTVTEGKFKTRITGWEDTPDPDPVQPGRLTVWTQQICMDGSPIEIRIAGQVAQLTDGLASEPECGAEGTTTFTLDAGNYTLEAICGTDTLRYDVTVSDRCDILEIDLQNPPVSDDYLPLITGSFWEYSELDDATSTQTITSEGPEIFDGRMYTRFVGNLGDTFYYRKEHNVYYEYRTLDFQGFVENPPSIEVVILYDDLQQGESWESAGEDVSYSGIPIKVKFVSTITQRDHSQTYNGVQYTDLIEVNTEIFFSNDGGASYQPSGSAYNTVYAKGKGIVYYYDIEKDTEWAVTNISLNP